MHSSKVPYPTRWALLGINGVIRLLREVVTPFLSGRGPPCKVYLCKHHSSGVVFVDFVDGVNGCSMMFDVRYVYM